MKATRKKASKVCWQCLAETFRETLVKELAANAMQEAGNRCLYIYMRGQDYLGVNGRQDAVFALSDRKQRQLRKLWQKCSLEKKRISTGKKESLALPEPIHAQTFFIPVRQSDVRVVLFGFLCRRNISRRHLQRRKLSRPADRIASASEIRQGQGQSLRKHLFGVSLVTGNHAEMPIKHA